MRPKNADDDGGRRSVSCQARPDHQHEARAGAARARLCRDKGYRGHDTANPRRVFIIEWGGTGAQNIGADPFNTYMPMIWFGKGLGDLPDTFSWLRPVAITGQFGYAIPGRNSTTTFGIDPDTGTASPIPNSIRACSTGVERSNTACLT